MNLWLKRGFFIRSGVSAWVIPALSLFMLYGCEDKVLQKDCIVTGHLSFLPDSDPALYPIVDDEQIILSAIELPDTSTTLYSYDACDFTLNWKLVLDDLFYSNLKWLKSGDTLILPGERSLASIDIQRGRTNWIKDYLHGEPYLSRFGSLILQSYNHNNKASIKLIDIATGRTLDDIQLNHPKTGRHRLRTPEAVSNGGTYLLASVISYFPEEEITYNYIVRVPLDGVRKVDTLQVGPHNPYGFGITKQPIIIGDSSVWLAHNALICIDHNAWKEIWKTSFPRSMLTSRPIVFDRFIYCAMEDGFLYKVEAATGKIVDKRQTSGTPSKLMFNGESIYMVGGGNGEAFQIPLDSEKAMITRGVSKGTKSKLKKELYYNRPFAVTDSLIVLHNNYNWEVNRVSSFFD